MGMSAVFDHESDERLKKLLQLVHGKLTMKSRDFS